MLFQALDPRASYGGSSAAFHQGRRDAVITFVLLPPTLFSSCNWEVGGSDGAL